MNKENKVLSIMSMAFFAILMIITHTSCDKQIYDDLEACPRGVKLRFVYDYNMLYANAFPTQVDCLTLFIYDKDGNYLDIKTEMTEVLKDENYRMQIDLPEGDYHFVAYGGLACEEADFSLVSPQSRATSLLSLQVQMEHNAYVSSQKLHDLFYGAIDVTVEGDMYVESTLHMMKNTNNIRIVLQQLNGNAVSNEDFTISIMDDNSLLAHDNDIIPNRMLTYFPWTQGQAVAGTMDDGDKEVIVAYSELSTSRLVTSNRPRLIIKNNESGRDVVNIPLNQYLLLLKSELYGEMGAQEFLDREYNWSMVFFLDEDHQWIRTHIKINDWTVRLNDTEL